MGVFTKTILAPPAEPAGEPHIPPENLARFAEGSLSAAERATMLGHLNRCPTCMEIAAAAMACLPEPAASAQPRSYSRMLYSLAASLLLVLAGLGVFQWQRAHQPMVATLELDAALRELILEDSAATWPPGERTERLVALLKERGVEEWGVDAKKIQHVAMAAPYRPSKSVFGPTEYLKVTIKGDTVRLEVVTKKE